jgi:hypothetical protein
MNMHRFLGVLLAIAVLALALAAPPSADHAAPTGLRVTGTTSSSVSLDWNDYAFPTRLGLGQFRVRLYNAAGTQIGQRDTGSRTSAYTYTGLTAGTTYRFAVAAVSTGGHSSAFSGRVEATPGGVVTPPPSPANPQPQGILWNGRALSAWVQQECPPYTTVDQLSDSTGSFIRTRVNASGEPCWGPPGGGTGSRNRAQIIPPKPTPARPIPRFSTRYYDFGVRFPARFGNMENSHCTVFDIVGASNLGCSGNHPDVEGQWLGIDRPTVCGWRAPLQKGQGWHHFVWKAYHDEGLNGRLTVWHKPPGASSFTRVINNCATETWTDEFGNATDGSFIVHSLYHGHNDPYAPEPWIDHRGAIVSTGHEID